MKKRTSEISMPRSLSSPRNPAFLSICVLLISAALFFIVLGSAMSAMGKFLLCAGVLVACGLLVTKWNKFEGGLGLYRRGKVERIDPNALRSGRSPCH